MIPVIAIVGRPNVGKSTLLNAIVSDQRVMTGPEAGITRDAIAVDWNYKGRAFKLVDTAGMRKKARVQNNIEKMSVEDSLRVVDVDVVEGPARRAAPLPPVLIGDDQAPVDLVEDPVRRLNLRCSRFAVVEELVEGARDDLSGGVVDDQTPRGEGHVVPLPRVDTAIGVVEDG